MSTEYQSKQIILLILIRLPLIYHVMVDLQHKFLQQLRLMALYFLIVGWDTFQAFYTFLHTYKNRRFEILILRSFREKNICISCPMEKQVFFSECIDYMYITEGSIALNLARDDGIRT